MDKKTIYIKTDFTVKFGASGQLANLINGAIMDAYSTSADTICRANKMYIGQYGH